VRAGPSDAGANYWGGGCNWGNRNLYVNHYNRTNNIGNNWQHNAAHRQGVRYNNANVQQRFGNNNLKAGASNRMDFRGRDGQQVARRGRIGRRRSRQSPEHRGSRQGWWRSGQGCQPRQQRRAVAVAAAPANVSSGRAAAARSARGRASMGGGAPSFAGRGGGGAALPVEGRRPAAEVAADSVEAVVVVAAVDGAPTSH
jgi:hypothetical protein